MSSLSSRDTGTQCASGYGTIPAENIKVEIGKNQTTVRDVEDQKVLDQDSLNLLATLHRKFDGKRRKLLEARKERQIELDSGKLPDFLSETADIRNDPSWRVGAIPADMQDRKVEITGPVDRKMVINALNSGTRTYMADFEDSTAPTWHNQIDGQRNLFDAIRRNISFTDPKSGKKYALSSKPAVLMARPRGLHLPESHVKIDGEVASGSFFDFAIYFAKNHKALRDIGSGPYFYLPKLQGYKEAQLWSEVFTEAETLFKVPKGTIKATVLLEHILAAFEAEEIVYALKEHMLGLNCGRWDYIFSYIKAFQKDPTRILPDRSLLSMKVPFMKSYSEHTIKVCHKRGAFAMGGMAAQIPIKGDPEANEKAMSLVEQDKERESKNGHDGTWVAHPGLVKLATDVFNKNCPTPNQIHVQRPDVNVTQSDLLALPEGTMTEKGLRHNIDVGIKYLESWLRGVGCVPIYNLMEDAATAEISRAQIWQWLRHGVELTNGQKVTSDMVEKCISDETKVWAVNGNNGGKNRAEDAANLFREMIFTKDMPEFLTLAAYDKLVSEGK